MSFHDSSKSSVADLLRLLQSTTNDDDPSAAFPLPASIPAPSAVPSKRQLDDLLSSLNQNQKPPPPPRTSTQPPHSTPSSSRRELIEPFGPVAQVAGPSRTSPKQPDGDGVRRAPRERRDEEGWRDMPFGKVLPVLTELLAEEGFRREVKRMKIEQDTLERRLWAKQERVKAEHEKGVQAEKDIARLSRMPLARDKPEVWRVALASSLADFHCSTCLPALDGLTARHREKLEELGVPGLGGADEKARERHRRIMDLLEAGLED